MACYHNVQMRFPADQIAPGKTFTYQGVEYTVSREVPQSLHPGKVPMGVIMNGYTAQYEITCKGLDLGEAWFYYYGSFEGQQWAVLDKLVLYGTAVS